MTDYKQMVENTFGPSTTTLSKQGFADAIERISSLPGAKGRIEVLYQYFKNRTIQEIQVASERAGMELVSFPVPAQFKEYLPKVYQDSVYQKCDKCDGYGGVVMGNAWFRGSCEHGQDLNHKIKLAPENKEEELDRQHKENTELYGVMIAERMKARWK